MLHTDVIIIGAGLAGLICAHHIRERSVIVVRPTPDDGSSYLARGGIAAAIDEEDAPEHHIADTLAAADGLADRQAVDILAREGVDRLIDLIEMSVGFDRDDDGRLKLGREALHSRDRIVHAAGDRTGLEVTSAVRQRLEQRCEITFFDGRALELVRHGDRVCGAIVADDDQTHALAAPCTVLATGGVGALFERTTNGCSARGEGLAMAARAGATLADLEFVQFHPTALSTCERPQPLLSEAIRGQGAMLVDDSDIPVMADHPRGDLAGRDVVARAIWRRIDDGGEVFLDATGVDDFQRQFPAAYQACCSHGVDPRHRPVPVTPAAHYHMGGVSTDTWGRTDLAGLWAIGEVACTGVHGANRLASNSLLEALVFGTRAGRDIATRRRSPHRIPTRSFRALCDSWHQGRKRGVPPWRCPTPKPVTQLMWRDVGIERTESRLQRTVDRLDALIVDLHRFDPRRLAIEAAHAIASSALERTESRGAHFRIDFPRRDDEFTQSVVHTSRFDKPPMHPMKAPDE